MPQILQPLKDIEKFFADLVVSFNELLPDHVLLQYSRLGQASYPIDEDWCSVKVMPESDPVWMYKDREKVYDESTETFTFTSKSIRTLTLSLVFYGPNSTYNATLFGERMYDENTKLVMAQRFLSIVPSHTVGPTRMPEQHNAQWYERCDLSMRLYNTVQVESKTNIFNEIDIRTEVEL